MFTFTDVVGIIVYAQCPSPSSSEEEKREISLPIFEWAHLLSVLGLQVQF